MSSPPPQEESKNYRRCVAWASKKLSPQNILDAVMLKKELMCQGASLVLDVSESSLHKFSAEI